MKSYFFLVSAVFSSVVLILYNRVIIAAFAKISKSYEEQSIDQIKVYAEIVTA